MRVSEAALQMRWLTGEVAVVGLGRSGQAVALLLARAGVSVYLSDGATSPALESAASTLRTEGVHVELGGHDLARIARASLVVTSPGIPPDAPPLHAAQARGVDVVSEVEIGLRFLPALRYVAITGTNGKTTTTALVAHLLRALRHRAHAAGNIGTPLTALAAAADPPPWVARELSSLQLHDTPSIAPEVGILTNLSANHLDRYSAVSAYYGDKALLFRNATPASTWITNLDDAELQRMVADVPGAHGDFSTVRRADAYCPDRDRDCLMVLGRPIIARNELSLIGDHNVANALAATLAVMLVDATHRAPVSIERIAEGLRTFVAIEHRIEPVGEFGQVAWINDSKSTNVASDAGRASWYDTPHRAPARRPAQGRAVYRLETRTGAHRETRARVRRGGRAHRT